MYENYYVEQCMDEGEVFCRFYDGDNFTEFLIFVSHNDNSVWIKRTCSDGVRLKPCCFVPSGLKSGSLEKNETNGVTVFTRRFCGNNIKFETELSVAVEENNGSNIGICVIMLNTNHDKSKLVFRDASTECFDKERADNKK